MLYKFPRDHITDTGQRFWSGTKRCPHILKFDPSNTIHLEFIVAASNLLAYIYSIPQVRDRDWITHELAKLQGSSLVENQINRAIHQSDDQEIRDIEQQCMKKHTTSNANSSEASQILARLPNLKRVSNIQLRPHLFEKDDDTNFHIDYIAATANLRAENYDIDIAERSVIKRVAGNIIPAIATTTAMITGFVCLEVYKLLQGHKKLESYRNASINLGLLRFCLFEPRPPAKKQVTVIYESPYSYL